MLRISRNTQPEPQPICYAVRLCLVKLYIFNAFNVIKIMFFTLLLYLDFERAFNQIGLKSNGRGKWSEKKNNQQQLAARHLQSTSFVDFSLGDWTCQGVASQRCNEQEGILTLLFKTPHHGTCTVPPLGCTAL